MVMAPIPRITPVRSVNASISHPLMASSLNPAYDGDPNHVGSHSNAQDAGPRLQLTQGCLRQMQNCLRTSSHIEGNGSSPVPVTSCRPGRFLALLPSWSREQVALVGPPRLPRPPPSFTPSLTFRVSPLGPGASSPQKR